MFGLRVRIMFETSNIKDKNIGNSCTRRWQGERWWQLGEFEVGTLVEHQADMSSLPAPAVEDIPSPLGAE
jgi:hypothetical protein